MQEMFLYLFLISPLSQPHMKHSYVFSVRHGQKDTLALIEPTVVTADTLEGIPRDKIYHAMIVARTVRHWCNKTKSVLVQVDNPSDRTTTLASSPLSSF